MQITITATEQLTSVDAIPVRVWEGVTDRGIRCKVFVHRVAVRADADTSAFEKELVETMPPGHFIPFNRVL